MSKKVLYALVIIGLLVILLIFNRGTVSINVLFDDVNCLKSIAFLIFTAIGVVIGVLLK